MTVTKLCDIFVLPNVNCIYHLTRVEVSSFPTDTLFSHR